MTDRRLRLLYLGNAYPPGWGGPNKGPLHGYRAEVMLWQSISKFADVSSVGLMHKELWERSLQPKDDAPGLDHGLLLWDRDPALWHRWISWRKLRDFYLKLVEQDEMPDAIVCYNLQHVFNYFVKWLRRQPKRPLIVLQIADSGGLGEKIKWSRKIRYKFKPMQMLEAQSVLLYDASIVSGFTAKRFFEPRGVPCLWYPACYKFDYQPPAPVKQSGPIRFGYFGSLSGGYATTDMVRAFLKAGVDGPLYVCGWGTMSEELEQMARQHPNFHFDGFLPKASDCLDWAQKVDVLINSRLHVRGQDNSFPSKVLEYGIARKAIVTSVVGGVDTVLGKEAIYFDPDNLAETLPKAIREVATMDRSELQRRAQIMHERIVHEFSPDEQARRIYEFLNKLVRERNVGG